MATWLVYAGALVLGLTAAACAAGCLAAMRQARGDQTATRLMEEVLAGLAAAARERGRDEQGRSLRAQYWKLRLRFAWAKLHLPISAVLFVLAAIAALMAGLGSSADPEQAGRWLLAALGIEVLVVVWWTWTLRGAGRRRGG